MSFDDSTATIKIVQIFISMDSHSSQGTAKRPGQTNLWGVSL